MRDPSTRKIDRRSACSLWPTTRPDVGAGLGSPSVLVEDYSVDPYDETRPAPSASYSATSKLLNIDITALANDEQYFGYAVKGAIVIGEESGAVAKITNINLITDNWGDLIGAFFFRDANTQPLPPVVFKKMYKHILTDKGIELFENDWKSVQSV